MEIKVMKSVMDANQNRANEIRKLLNEKNVKMINLIGSPGAGKTSLLEKTLENINNKYKIAIIEGDLATDKDAQRLKKYNVPIVLINTEGGCYLPSVSVEKALKEFSLDDLDLIFIENVGNLVCPAHFDVGENTKIAVLSVTEGDDKPSKYPLLFNETDIVILNKIDLLKHTNFNNITFQGHAQFTDATFMSSVDFQNVIFSQGARFENATFKEKKTRQSLSRCFQEVKRKHPD